MLFILVAGLLAAYYDGAYSLVLAAMVGAYMAMNIGANDVANVVGPLAAINEALGSGAIVATAGIPAWVITMPVAGLLAAAVFGVLTQLAFL